MKIGIRMRLLGLISLIALILTTLTGWHYIEKTRAPVLDLTGNIVPTLAILNRLSTEFSDSRRNLLLMVMEQDESRMRELERQFNAGQERIQALMSDYDTLLFDEQDRRYAMQARKELATYNVLARQVILAAHQQHKAQSMDMINRMTAPQATKVFDQLLTMSHYYGRLTSQANKSISNGFATLLSVLSGLCLAAGLLMLLTSELVTRSVIEPLYRLRDFVVGMVQHLELSQRLTPRGHDEVAETTRAFNSLLDSIQNHLRELPFLGAAPGDHVGWLRAPDDDAGRNPSKEAPAALPSPNARVQDGGTVDSYAFVDAAEPEEGKARAEPPADIVNVPDRDCHHAEVIRQIADQAHVLSRNAAVAAAQAGELGRGFAISAEQVRRLARRSASSSDEIVGSIGLIRREASQAVEVIDRLATGEKAGLDDEVVRQLNLNAEVVERRMGWISSALQAHGSVSGAMVQEIDKVARMTEQTSATALGTSEVSNDLHRLACQMQQLIRQCGSA
ncbi:methyl-accepting chemotaxis protein [Chitiniphilus eburneus]|uniref:Methyl-accepting chemotaxis protein n=1 Tax=Chitiniphilus eburneus TaxID=2571148 RepID=A0A4U0QC60_9NEIS|nr:methyl-accepting chemotaxis protein [Chitiniphilus eburneus]TJZ78720.1 methyl-accepting chemotaxis protein [Chitiniphilus eburneus]